MTHVNTAENIARKGASHTRAQSTLHAPRDARVQLRPFFASHTRVAVGEASGADCVQDVKASPKTKSFLRLLSAASACSFRQQ